MIGVETMPAATRPLFKSDKLRAACAIAGLSVRDCTGSSKLMTLCKRRWHVMAILHGWGMSGPEIARLVQRDHSTVYHGLRRWEQMQKEAA